MSRPSDLRDAAKSAKLNAALSQCFLVDNAILSRIAAAVPVDLGLPVLEIGPGTGHLTRHVRDRLPETVPMMVVEYDERFIPELNTWPGVTVIHSDILRVNLPETLDTLTGQEAGSAIVVGNLPYRLTGPILFGLFGELHDETHPVRQRIATALIMVQKEVGERLIAKPGDSAYSQLTLQLRCWADITEVLFVPKSAFEPVPKVDSMVLQITPRLLPSIETTPQSWSGLARFVKQAFLHRRKTLANNLKLAGYSAATVAEALSPLGLSQTCRPQEVTLEGYAQLYNRLGHDAL